MGMLLHRPWKQPEFDGTLIIGESLPRGGQCPGATGWLDLEPGYPDEMICDHLLRAGIRQKERLFELLRQCFDPVIEDPCEFWNQKAFTNFIPGVVPPGATMNDKPWHLGRAAFPDVLEAVKPRRVLVASARAYDELPKPDERFKHPLGQGSEADFSRFGEVLVTWIRHPTGSKGKYHFDLTQARRVVAALMSVAP